MSRRICLYTRYSESDETWNAVWRITDQRITDLENITISLEMVSFPNTVYPINAYNNTLYFNENGGALISGTVEPGFYSGSEFAQLIEDALNTLGALTYTVTYSSDTFKLTISVAGVNDFEFFEGTYDMLDEMGFDRLNLTSHTTTFTLDFPVKINGTSHVQLLSNLGNLCTYPGTSINIWTLVPVDVVFGNEVFYMPNNDESLEIYTRNIHEIAFQLRDEKGNPFELPGNSHMTIILKIEEMFDYDTRKERDAGINMLFD